MKVVLNVDAVRYPLTGIGRYTYELARQLQDHPQIESLKLFSGSGYLEALPEPVQRNNSHHVLKLLVQRSALASEAYRRLMPALRARALRGHSDFLYHGTNFTLPPVSGRSVATFHDLSPFTWPQTHTPKRVAYLQKELRATLQRADALITDSEFTRQELAAFSDIPLARIHSVPLASSAAFHPRAGKALEQCLGSYALTPQGYTLFVGTIEPRKNLLTLLDAYGCLPQALRKRWPLILSGYQGWRSEEIHARIQAAERAGWARYLGFVPAAHLPLLFSGARLFAFPSLYEGFGLPVLEAMSSGVPVVCSNSSSLPEVAGGAALLCDPLDVQSLTNNLQRALEDNLWRAQAIAQGLRHAAGFSWQRCATETVAVYKRVMED